MTKRRTKPGTGTNVTGVALTQSDLGQFKASIDGLRSIETVVLECPHCHKKFKVKQRIVESVINFLRYLLSKCGRDVTLHFK